jgi:AhpC/TSA family.
MYPQLSPIFRQQSDIQVIVLSMNTASENQTFLEEFNLTNYTDLRALSATREVVEKYLIRGTPTFVVIDEDGIIMNTGYAITAEQISGLIRK